MIRVLSKGGYPVPKKNPINIDLYHNFLRSVHMAIDKTESEPTLAQSFSRINDQYFFGAIEPVNLRWGQESFSKLGSYDFGTDTITISKALHPRAVGDNDLLDYVMYHEMLHKKHKFQSSARRTRSHTTAFRFDESKFKDAKLCESRLRRLRPFSRRFSNPKSSNPFQKLVDLVFQ